MTMALADWLRRKREPVDRGRGTPLLRNDDAIERAALRRVKKRQS
jgi:hypothetical protein